MEEPPEEPDWSAIALHTGGRVAFGAMAFCGIFAIFSTINAGENALALPLALAPLLAVAALAVLPGRRAVVTGAASFAIGILLLVATRKTNGSIEAFLILFGLILGQGGWWHLLRQQSVRGLRSYDAALFFGGLAIGFILSMGSTLWGVLPAGITAGIAIYLDRDLALKSTIEKSFQHLSVTLRVMSHNAWMLRLLGFMVIFALAVTALIFYWVSDKHNSVEPIIAGLLLIPFGLTLVPSVWKKADRLSSRWLIGGSCGLLLLIQTVGFVLRVTGAPSLRIEIWLATFLVAAFVLPLVWRRLVNEVATPLPHPMRYLAEPLLITIIGISALCFASGIDSVAETIRNETSLSALSTVMLTLILATIAAFTLELPNETYRRPKSDFVDVLFFPGQNPLIQLPRGADACVVSIAYWIPLENQESFEKILPAVGKVRRRAGALGWQVTKDSVDELLWREHFTVDSWSEYADAIKLETPRERDLKQELFNLNDWESLPSEDHYPIRVT